MTLQDPGPTSAACAVDPAVLGYFSEAIQLRAAGNLCRKKQAFEPIQLHLVVVKGGRRLVAFQDVVQVEVAAWDMIALILFRIFVAMTCVYDTMIYAEAK